MEAGASEDEDEGDGGEEEEGVEAQGHRLGQGWKGAPTTNRVKYFGA